LTARRSAIRTSLEEPIRFDRRFDLAISVEVMEHLSPERGEGFVRDLCALSDVVLFSGAILGQGGVHHVNERWPSHWAGAFAGHGYGCHDVLRARFRLDDDIRYWYRQNVLLFVARDSDAERRIGPNRFDDRRPLDLVHPETLRTAVAGLRPEAIGGSLALKARWHVFRRKSAGLLGRGAR